jgi:hypothetical protein
MKIFKVLFIFISVFFSFPAENMIIHDFVHCNTGLTKEQAIFAKYSLDSAGKKALRADLKDIIELRLADRVTS